MNDAPPDPMAPDPAPPPGVRLAIVGAGPVGLSLALMAAASESVTQITLFDARPADRDLSADPRALALSLGSVQILHRLGAWSAQECEPIREVRVSQQPASMLDAVAAQAPEVRIRADDEGVPMLGAVVTYGQVVDALQRRWTAVATARPGKCRSRFGQAVAGLRDNGAHVEIDAGIVDTFDLVVVAEGGVFADQARKSLAHDYRQHAWVGTVALPADAPAGVAYERFTRHGPAALLPLHDHRAALVWCVNRDDDPVAPLDDAQRLVVLNSAFPRELRPLASLSDLKCFPLGLNAERTLTHGRIVRIGNAAQTLHPVAGQGLNLGLRDAWDLVRSLQRHGDIDTALRRLEWRRAPDRWSMIAATDFLARSFTWQWPGVGAARALGLAALQNVGPLKSALARRMMFGSR